MSAPDPTIEDLIAVLALSAIQLGSFSVARGIRSWKPIDLVKLARYNYEVASSSENVAKCDAWLRLYEKISECKVCMGKRSVSADRSSGGCSGDHWGDCDRDCLPHRWTEHLPCGECNATGRNERAKSVLG